LETQQGLQATQEKADNATTPADHVCYDGVRSKTPADRGKWISFGTYAVVTYMISLRGSEGFLLDLGGLLRHQPTTQDKKKGFFLIPLLGKVKGEHHDRCHLLPCTYKSSSGIEPYAWINQLLVVKKEQNLQDGPAFSDEKGRVLSASVIDEAMHTILEELLEHDSSVFPNNIKSLDDIQTNYQAFRSFRRSSDTRAIEERVSVDDINLVNRWHVIDRAQGKRPTLEMRYHYAQYEELVKPFIRYTRAM
jgi:hypothetical protein